MKLRELANGAITLTTRGEYADLDILTFAPGCDCLKTRMAQPGDVGCLSITENISPIALGDRNADVSAHLLPNESGIPGNSNSNICRLHGWRGTSNDSRVVAMGWRRVLDVKPIRRGWIFKLSVDLQPDAE